jgi:hypothetical protein
MGQSIKEVDMAKSARSPGRSKKSGGPNKQAKLVKKLATGQSPANAKPALDGSEPMPRVLYADLDAVYVDPADGNIIHGYFARLPSLAYAKSVPNYINRMDLRDFYFEMDCPGSNEGIWKFLFAD